MSILSVTPPEAYAGFPTFDDFLLLDNGWSPEPNGNVEEHILVDGNTFASSEVNPGETVQIDAVVKDGEVLPTNHTVVTATFTGPTTKKYIITNIKPRRLNGIWAFTATLTHRDSMPNPT